MDGLLLVFNAFLPLESSEVPLIHKGNMGNNWSRLSIIREKKARRTRSQPWKVAAEPGCGAWAWDEQQEATRLYQAHQYELTQYAEGCVGERGARQTLRVVPLVDG